MPRHLSVEKRHRQEVKQNAVARARRSRVRTFVKKFELRLEGLAKGTVDLETVRSEFQATQSELARAAQKGVMHRNAASRKISRLSLRITKTVAASATA